MTSEQLELISADPRVMHGQAVIAGTRVPVSVILDCLAAGMTAEQITAEYPTVTDAEVIDAFQRLASSEGIIAALESAHALAWILREAPTFQGATVLMNLSGRGDKDVAQMMEILGR